jgi:hypothetical protein
MPFGGFSDLYESVYVPAISEAGLTPHRADDLFRPGTITSDIWAYIKKAKVLLADLTGKNPNVFYELGLAHALAKPAILIAESLDDVPFNLRGLRVIKYDKTAPDWGEILKRNVKTALKEVITSPAKSLLPAFVDVRSAVFGSKKRATTRSNGGDTSANVRIWKEYPPSYAADFARAKDLWMSGLNLRRIIPSRLGDIRRVLEGGGTVRVLLLDPDYDGCRDAAIQEWGRSDRSAIERYRKMIRNVHSSFSELRNRNTRKQIKIRKIGYSLGFGVDAIDLADRNAGVLYVRFYPISGPVMDDRPILPLKSRDGYWYKFYQEQLEYQWACATPWE